MKNLSHNHRVLIKVMSYSALIQAVSDINLELLSAIGVIDAFPFRFSFLILTIISALMAMETLHDLMPFNLLWNRRAVINTGIVELGLVLSDVYFVLTHLYSHPLWWLRLPFMMFTTFNVIIIFYTGWKYLKPIDVFNDLI